MKQKIVQLISRHFYPQNIFADSILKHISSGSSKRALIDAPCGNGETSWRFSKNKNLMVYAYDLDETSVQTAKLNYKADNLHFDVLDIFQVIAATRHFDYFCIINSLFLLPEPGKILRNLREKMVDTSTLFVIVPNTKGRNFEWFNTKNRDLNKLILSRESFESYFLNYGLNIVKVEPIAFTHNFGRTDVKLFSVFSHFYLRGLNFFQTSFSIGKPNYYLIVLNKELN